MKARVKTRLQGTKPGNLHLNHMSPHLLTQYKPWNAKLLLNVFVLIISNAELNSAKAILHPCNVERIIYRDMVENMENIPNCRIAPCKHYWFSSSMWSMKLHNVFNLMHVINTYWGFKMERREIVYLLYRFCYSVI